jgi:hypothetical protein
VRSAHYRFVVAGRIDPGVLADFEILRADYADGKTTLSAVVHDPQALTAILARLIDLDLILLERRADGPTDGPEVARPG